MYLNIKQIFSWSPEKLGGGEPEWGSHVIVFEIKKHVLWRTGGFLPKTKDWGGPSSYMERSLYNWVNSVPNLNNFGMYAKYGHIYIQTLNLTGQQYALSCANIQKNLFFPQPSWALKYTLKYVFHSCQFLTLFVNTRHDKIANINLSLTHIRIVFMFLHSPSRRCSLHTG